MFKIKNDIDNQISYSSSRNIINTDNCVFTSTSSRPSKSLIDCDLYKEHIKINKNYDEFSYIKNQNKSLEYFVLIETINFIKNKFNEEINYDDFSISFDNITINENANSNNIIYCIDNQLFEKNNDKKENSFNIIINNLLVILKEINENDILIMNYLNLFTYPNAELLIIISLLFEKIIIYFCKILKQNILICKNYKKNDLNNIIYVFIKHIYKNTNKNIYIRQLGIFIDNNILDTIKNYNTYIFNYYKNLQDIILNINFKDKEYFFKNYTKRLNINKFSNECCHEFIEYNILNSNNNSNYFICKKCYDVFCIY